MSEYMLDAELKAYLPVLTPVGVVSTFGRASLGDGVGSFGAHASAVYPAANRALAFPFRLGISVSATRFGLINGASVAGNIDLGVYDEDWNLVVSTGLQAQAGIGAIQTILCNLTRFGPGLFYLAIVSDDAANCAIYRSPASAARWEMLGAAQMNAAGPPLPAVFVPAVMATAYLPMFGFSVWPRTFL